MRDVVRVLGLLFSVVSFGRVDVGHCVLSW